MKELMAQLISFALSEEGLTLLGWLLGLGFTTIMGTDKIKKWLSEAKRKKLQEAYKLLESAIVSNRDRVDEMKRENGGKLSADQKKQLEDAVLDDLKRKTLATGIDVVKVIGPELIKPAILHTVRRVKGKMVGQDATALPSSVASMFPDTDN